MGIVEICDFILDEFLENLPFQCFRNLTILDCAILFHASGILVQNVYFCAFQASNFFEIDNLTFNSLQWIILLILKYLMYLLKLT